MASFEEEHVHQVYDQIAFDFSRTRHTRWPFCQRFLEALPAGSVVLDAGCGNGKYLPVRSILPHPAEEESSKSSVAYLSAEGADPAKATVPTLLNIGLDMSQGLLSVAERRGHEVVRGDCFDLSCWREGAFDHAISIAIIHHFSTVERRCEAIKQLILAVTPPRPRHTPSTSTSSTPSNSRSGTFIASVWSLEQDSSLVGVGSARRKTGAKKGAIPIEPSLLPSDPSAPTPQHPQEPLGEDENPRGADHDEDVQDVFVSWALQPAQKKRERKAPPLKGAPNREPYTGPRNTEGKKARRKREKELEEAAAASEGGASSTAAGSEVGEGEVEAAVAKLSLDPPAPKEESVPAPDLIAPVTEEKKEEEQPTFLRYYHLFRHGEMSALVARAASELGIAMIDTSEDSIARLEGNEQPASKSSVVDQREGEGRWERVVELKGEVFERENWCIHCGVSWVYQARRN